MSIPRTPTEPVSFMGAQVGAQPAPLLEGVLQIPEGKLYCPGVVICHANPKAGGHMDMKPLLAIESALSAQGFATLRYNSRGIGNSTGRVSGGENKRLIAPEGEPETADVAAAVNFLAAQEQVDPNRLALVGHSFGARISLSYLNVRPPDDRIQAVVCIGLGVAWGDLSHLGKWPGPKLFITGDRDDFSPPGLLESFVATLPPPANQVTMRDTGHFFEGRESDLARIVVEFLGRVMPSGERDI